ncbi:LysR substrate-binding domain-containing protein [Frateuria aurantia]
MSMRPLPPLNALRVFEAAGRLGSFLAAAKELNVTAGAVSRHIALLEDSVGEPLFVRLARGVELTIAGRAYLHDIQPSFERIAIATMRRRQHLGRHLLRIDVQASFALRWLLPRLSLFRRRHMEVDLHITSSRDLAEGREKKCDMLIHAGSETRPGYDMRPFLSNWRTPVCSPHMPGADRLGQPSDLREQTLLFADQLTSAWTDWLGLAGEPSLVSPSTIHFDAESLAIGAAEQGLGVALPSYQLVAQSIKEGRLVAPFANIQFHTDDYCTYIPKSKMHQGGVGELAAWLLEEGGRASLR